MIHSQGDGTIFDGTDGCYVELENVELGGPMTIALWARFDASGWYERLIDFAGDDIGSNRDNIIIGREGLIP